MKKNCTEIVFILDRSGSMYGLEQDTIGGFNSMIKEQKEKEGEVFVSTLLFDDVTEVLHDRVKIEEIQPMTERDYRVRGCTALLDAIGGAIHYLGNLHRKMPNEHVPEHTLFVIITDGMENASQHYSYDKIREMVSRQEKRYGWEFLFLGANIDSIDMASHLGIHNDHAVNYHSDHIGTQLNYEVLSDAIITIREGETLQQDWKARIDDDYQRRGPNRSRNRR